MIAITQSNTIYYRNDNHNCSCTCGTNNICYGDCGSVTSLTIDEPEAEIDIDKYSRSLSIPPLIRRVRQPRLAVMHGRVVRFASRERGIGTRNYHKI